MSHPRPKFRFFFAHNLKKYIDAHLYSLEGSEELFELLPNCCDKDLEYWEKLPLGYLTEEESLSLALSRAFSRSGARIHHDDSFREILRLFEKYFEGRREQEAAYSFAYLSLGVIFLERALFETVDRQRKFLQLSSHYLEEAEQAANETSKKFLFSGKLLEVTYLYRTLVEVCCDELPCGIRYLSRAAKISSNPTPLWNILASIYHHLGMIRVSHFYRQKANHPSSADASQNTDDRDDSQMVA